MTVAAGWLSNTAQQSGVLRVAAALQHRAQLTGVSCEHDGGLGRGGEQADAAAVAAGHM
jgi:hypothetical protein